MKTAVAQKQILGTNNRDVDWTFLNADTRPLSHCFHDYPARMIPQVAAKVIKEFGKGKGILFDPFCGSGTTLVEGIRHGFTSYGTDLNPLARLIALAKTNPPNSSEVRKLCQKFKKYITSSRVEKFEPLEELEGISSLKFWFKETVISKLSAIRNFIDQITDARQKSFFQVAFSETVRICSNTRNHEFKLYRYTQKELDLFNPNVVDVIEERLNRNLLGLVDFEREINDKNWPQARVFDFNTVVGVPSDLPKFDLVLTSPPYGDSRTTVAYGQYSRLSSAWLGLPAPASVDGSLLGGRLKAAAIEIIQRQSSVKLKHAIAAIAKVDERRAREVASFFVDMLESIKHIADHVNDNGIVAYVVANRRVKGVTVPLDDAIIHGFFEHGLRLVNCFRRKIPNKRMPARNSPSNKPGKTAETMSSEIIVVMRK